eukprot:GHVS01076994.1.p1 GENE.GHVS01076994.1~~GHVS01076994.1.p1  ORF type:complete len:269 (+),score=9.84 GHVS01076994.1:173-979(+)
MHCLGRIYPFWNRLSGSLVVALSISTHPMANGKCADPTLHSSMFNIISRKCSVQVPSHFQRPGKEIANIHLLVIAGPSGVGKGTLVKKLISDFPDSFGFCVSHTSRAPRTGEVHGRHYFFQNKKDIMDLVAKGQFVEYAEVHGNVYGTSFQEVSRVSSEGKICLVEVDVQGVSQIKSSPLGGTARFVFIRPPSLGTLNLRLRARGTDDDDTIGRRIKAAQREIDEAELIGFDIVIVNNILHEAYSELKSQSLAWFPLLMKARSDGHYA